ncbi:MAG: GNAT family N-acetyltransferase [Thermodesulfobacteriota bacterium]
MSTPESIETPRLRLVPFSEMYLGERYVGWLNDPEVVRFSEQRHRVHTLETCRKYLASFEGSPDYFWAILLKSGESAHIGNISAHVDVRNQVADVGILIGEKSCWGKGYGLEAFRGVLDFLFRRTGVRKVTAGTMATNQGMIRIMERAGMQEDGTRMAQVLLEGRPVDILHRALFRKNWEKSSNGIQRQSEG